MGGNSGMATEPQLNYIYGLAEKRDISKASLELQAWLKTPIALENATNQEVQMILAALKELPLKVNEPTPNSELAQVEAKVDKGFYFIVDPTDNTEKFFRVDKPEPPSRWSGYTFIKVQASDYLYPVKDTQHRLAILKTIAADPITAMNEYGIRLGVCGSCGRTLTARDSRLRGMGPICAARILGQPTEDQLDILRKLGLKKD
jgi:hypothetical protein